MEVRLCGDLFMNNLHGFLDFFIHYDYKVGGICESKLEVINHSKKNPYKEKDDFNTNILRIAYATARTICSYHPDYQELHLDILSSLFSQINLVDRNYKDFLAIKSNRYERLRDFSKSTRIGELAQGINYLFIQKKGYPFIVDYKHFCDVSGIMYSGKSPDFVIMNGGFNKIGLLESKGEASLTNTVQRKLKMAINQLKGANIKLKIDVHIPCCARFERNDSTDNSSINYKEIQIRNSNKTISDEEKLKLIRMHYASWFSLVGDFERDKQLLEGGNIGELLGDRYKKEDKYYWVKDLYVYKQLEDFLHVNIDFHLHSSNNKFRIGISKNIVDNLLVVDNFDGLQNKKEEETEKGEENGYYYFEDGTVIQIMQGIE